MNRKHQNEAIAFSLGWRKTADTRWYDPRGNLHRFPPDYVGELIPAFHAVEQFKEKSEIREAYEKELVRITKAKNKTGLDVLRVAQASSMQRTEALVRALGKWINGDVDDHPERRRSKLPSMFGHPSPV